MSMAGNPQLTARENLKIGKIFLARKVAFPAHCVCYAHEVEATDGLGAVEQVTLVELPGEPTVENLDLGVCRFDRADRRVGTLSLVGRWLGGA
jgi:hypothetical protein